MLKQLHHLSCTHKLLAVCAIVALAHLGISGSEIAAYMRGEAGGQAFFSLLAIVAIGAGVYVFYRNENISDDAARKLAALNQAQAVIEFDLDGNILSANDNFLKTMGYRQEEIRGEHHRMFVGEDYAESQDYRDFWHDLRQGKFKADKYIRYGKDGKEVWIQATYNPVLGADGKPEKVVKFAVDVTHELKEAKRGERIQTALDCVTSNVMVADENYDILFMNPALEKMLSANEEKIREELPNFKVDDIIGGNIDRFHKEPSHQRRMLDGLTSTYETTISIAGLSFDLVASPIFDNKGAKLGIVVEWQDYTEID